MSFVDQSRRPSPASMAAVVAIHAAAGAALIIGLTVSGVIRIDDKPLISTEYKLPPPPPVDPVEPPKARPTETTIFTPAPRKDLTPAKPHEINTKGDTILPLPGSGSDFGIKVDLPKPLPQPGFDPVAARAKNDPSGWLTDNDYRPSWARRELAGLAGFRLEIAANGKVTGCSITRSTGHPELDQATCALVTKRARFEPARGISGEPVAGSYTSSVLWELPD